MIVWQHNFIRTQHGAHSKLEHLVVVLILFVGLENVTETCYWEKKIPACWKLLAKHAIVWLQHVIYCVLDQDSCVHYGAVV